MDPSKKIGESPVAKKVVIKGNAHLFTLLSAIWTAFSLIGVFLFRSYSDADRLTDVTVAVTIWTLHLIFIGLSIFFWITETPSKVLLVDDDSEGEG
jgi:hypothetical protein